MRLLEMKKDSRLLDAVHLATRKLATLEDTEIVLRDVLEICISAVGAEGGTIYLHDPATQTLTFRHVLPQEVADKLERMDIPDDYGVAGQVFRSGAAQRSVFQDGPDEAQQEIQDRSGVVVRTMITVPLQIADMPPIGVVQLVNKLDGEFNDSDEMVLDTVSDVSTLAVMHSRLLEHGAQIASLQGMGRAAHDLANKAGVVMTYLPDFERNLAGLRDQLGDSADDGAVGMYLEALEDNFRDVLVPYSERVYRYAKLISDLASGKALAPIKKNQSFGKAVRVAVEYLESQARKNHVALEFDLQEGAPTFEFDDMFVMRIAENLVGNAVKAVVETIPDDWLAQNGADIDATFGTVVIRYRYLEDHHILEVEDEGPGMSPATIRQILTGKARSAWIRNTGSGLGTKAVLELAATHDARVSIDSKLGEGTTFRVDFPQAMSETGAA